MVTDVLGNVVSLHDYLAFGGELDAGYAGRTKATITVDAYENISTGQIVELKSKLGN